MAMNWKTTENEATEDKQTWNKFSATALKAGYRDGIEEGRNQTFEKSFLEGYAEGFKSGFALGKYQGVLRASLSEDLQKGTNKEDITFARQGNCQMCKDKDLLERNIKEITKAQTQATNNVLEKLHLEYSHKTHVILPIMLK